MAAPRFARLLLGQCRCLPLRSARTRRATALATGTSTGAYMFSLWSSKSTEETEIKSKLPPLLTNTDYTAIAQADKLYSAYLIDNLYEYMRQHRLSTNAELLWRCARASYEKSQQTKDAEEKRSLVYEAYDIAKLALKYGDDISAVHKWYGILLDKIGEYESRKARLKHSSEVREHFERAVQLDPNDATSHNLLGIWHYTFADMDSMTRLLAKTFFATPPSSTYEEALKYFLDAEKVAPKFYSKNLLYIGLCYIRMGYLEEAVAYFKDAFRMPVVSVEDMQTKKAAQEELMRVMRFEEMLQEMHEQKNK